MMSNAVEVIAHRGIWLSESEQNTLQAIDRARIDNIIHVEIDVRITQEGHLVLHHDAELDGKKISELSLTQVRQRGSLPTLEEAVARAAEDINLLVDIKDEEASLFPAIVKALDAFPELVCQSESLHLLIALREANDGRPLLLVHKLKRSWFRAPAATELVAVLQKEKLQGITAKGRPFIDRAYVDAFTTQGLIFYVWTINSKKDQVHYLALGVSGIITDLPDQLIQRQE